MKARTSLFALAAAAVFAVGAFTGWMAPAILRTARADAMGTAPDSSLTASRPAASASTAAAPVPIPLGTAPNYRAIVAQNRDAVVGITTAGEMKVATVQPFGPMPFGPNPFGDDDNNPLSQFFRHLPGPQGHVPMHAQGSGFIVNSAGIVLTNAHVVEGAKEVTVKLIDHREFTAKVLGTDKASDIAVLKIDAKGLPFVRIGNSDQLERGRLRSGDRCAVRP